MSSTICAMPVAPTGCPLRSKPPEVFTGMRPPSRVAPESISLPPSPLAHSPSDSYAISSAGAEASWHSTTSRSTGPSPAASYASAAHSLRPCRARRRRGPSRSPSTLAAIRTGMVMPCSRALRSLMTMTTAAAPSPIGEHIGRVSGSAIIGAASTSSTVRASRNWARGLRLPWNEFFAETAANCSTVVP